MMICKAKGSKPAGVACTMLLPSRWSCGFARIDLNCKEDLKQLTKMGSVGTVERCGVFIRSQSVFMT